MKIVERLHQSYVPKIFFNGRDITSRFDMKSLKWTVVEKYPKAGEELYDKNFRRYFIIKVQETETGHIFRVQD